MIWWAAVGLAVFITPSMAIAIWAWHLENLSRLPAPPDVLVPEGWTHWHWDGRQLLQYAWHKGRWRRTKAAPIEPCEIPELMEDK